MSTDMSASTQDRDYGFVIGLLTGTFVGIVKLRRVDPPDPQDLVL